MAAGWKKGFEIELIAPRGSSRARLAEAVRGRVKGTIRQFFHPQSEISKVPGKPVFDNLTAGFRVLDANGGWVASLVDDITLQHGLNKSAPPSPGWYRIVSDDGRILQLAIQQCDPLAPLDTVLDPLARLFGTEVDHHASGMVKVADARLISVAIGAPLPGERERPCEIITGPLADGYDQRLRLLLGEARNEGFALPREGATHIHFDAAPLKSANAVANIAALFTRHGTALKELVGTNPNCIRLGPWPAEFAEIATSEDFLALDWPKARDVLKECELKKYCDYNLVNMLVEMPHKDTFEVRVLPSYLEAEPIIMAAELFEAILTWCVETRAGAVPVPDTLPQLLAAIPLDRAGAARWQNRLRQ